MNSTMAMQVDFEETHGSSPVYTYGEATVVQAVPPLDPKIKTWKQNKEKKKTDKGLFLYP